MMKRILSLILAVGVAGAAEFVKVQATPLKAPAGKGTKVFLGHKTPRALPGVKSPQPDTIAYDDGSPSWGYNWPGMWGGVRFTPLSDFQLRAFYVPVYNVAAQEEDTIMYFRILLDNGTTAQEPDSADSVIYEGAFYVDPGFYFYQVDLADSLDFSAGQDFYIFVGPQGNSFGQRTLTFDGTGDANRSFETSDWTTFYLETGGDMVLQAGGEYSGAFVDLAMVGFYTTSKKYFLANGGTVPVTFHAVIQNNGTSTVNSYVVDFAVTDTLGTTVFTTSVTAGPIAPGATDTVTATADWTPPTASAFTPYTATADVSLPLGDDSDPSNDVADLEQYTYDPTVADWFMYTDFSVDALFSWADDNMWAMRFVPDAYPAKLSAIAFYFSIDGNAAGDTISDAPIYVFADDGTDGAPGTLLYADTVSIVFTSSQSAGLISIPVDITLNSGGVVVAYQYHTDPDGSYLRLGKDATPPIAGSNWYMAYSAFNYFAGSGTWEPDNTGDWFIWAYFEPPCTCGDLNNDGTVDPMDLVYMTAYFFQGGPAPQYPNCADVDGSGTFDKADIAYLANYLFMNGPAPACP